MRGLGPDYKDTEATTTNDFVRLPAGGYVCRILSVENHEDEKPYLRIVYDISEGEYRDYYSDEWGTKNEWAHDNRHYYSPKAFGMFKGFLKAIDESNGTNFEEAAEEGFDERKLVGLSIGYLIGYDEYIGTNGSINTKPTIRGTRSVATIREGRFKIPELKKLETAPKEPEPEPKEYNFPF